jgi:hypothetical protein
MIPDFPNARHAMLELRSRALFAGLNGTDPLISEIPVRVQKEGNAAHVAGNEIQYEKVSVQSSFQSRDAEGMINPDLLIKRMKTITAMQFIESILRVVSGMSGAIFSGWLRLGRLRCQSW